MLDRYPEASETYVKTELEAVTRDYDVRIIRRYDRELLSSYSNHFPYELQPDADRVVEIVEEFRPQVIHSHYVREIKRVAAVAERTGVPYTIRSHSFDVLTKPKRLAKAIELMKDDLCLGVLAFPFAVPLFIEHGAPEEKVLECWPVIDYEAFHDRGPNGDAIMNCGAAISKKEMPSYIDLAASTPELEFNLYALGYEGSEVEAYNEEKGRPVTISRHEPEEMPREYKKHRWLVYTAKAGDKDAGVPTVGWPMAVAEAQAAGVGALLQNIRPDVKEYVGEAGFVFDTIDEARRIISQPFPDELRELGFEHARRSDIREHLPLLTGLWEKTRVGVS
jgi:hypothetical protein